MVGKKGMRNPSKHRRKNGWTSGALEIVREKEVFAFKLSKELYPRVKAEIEERGISKQAFVDDLLACYYGDEDGGDLPEIDVNHPLVQDALRIALIQKQAALRAEKKKKPGQQDQAQIEKWEGEIESLEVLISG